MDMDPRLTRVIDQLDGFEPSEVDVDTTHRLYEILDGFAGLPGREAAIPTILAVMERHHDAELGAPGPLVHELEALPGYEPLLRESLARQPTGLTVWMVNRSTQTFRRLFASSGFKSCAWWSDIHAPRSR